MTDWSEEQLQKHSREITSLLGNLYMRAASAKITKRVSDIPKPVVTAISESMAFAPLIAALKALAPTYETNMRSFQLADAVDAVMLALQEVRASFKFLRLP